MSQIIKIIKENDLKIPIGTKLHFKGIFDKISNTNFKTWDSVGCYIWQDIEGNLHVIKESELYPKYKDNYINIIVLCNLKFACEGDTYWKVFTNKKDTQYHKLEYMDGKHLPAICFKPYKDKVYSNTNSRSTDCSTFKTEEEAIEYILGIDPKYKKEQL